MTTSKLLLSVINQAIFEVSIEVVQASPLVTVLICQQNIIVTNINCCNLAGQERGDFAASSGFEQAFNQPETKLSGSTDSGLPRRAYAEGLGKLYSLHGKLEGHFSARLAWGRKRSERAEEALQIRGLSLYG